MLYHAWPDRKAATDMDQNDDEVDITEGDPLDQRDEGHVLLNTHSTLTGASNTSQSATAV